MAITTRDKHGTLTKRREAGDGPALDRATARHYAVVDGVWSKPFPTKREAQRAERDMKGQADRGVKLAGSAMTLQAFYDDVWWPAVEARQRRGDIAIGTAIFYRNVARGYILPTFGERRLRDLRPGDLRAHYAALGERGLSARTVQATHKTLTAMLAFALDDGYVTVNVAKARDVSPRTRAAETTAIHAWDGEQSRTFLAHVADDRLAALWRLAALTGMRRGELLGLRWSAVDLDAAQVRVERSLVLNGDYRVRYSTPKTARSRRTIDLDGATVAALRAHRRAQAAERLASLGAWPSEGDDAGLVFTDPVGQPLHPRLVTARFAELVDGTDLPKIRLHDLRHTAATLMLKAGVPVHIVSARLGHASVSITLDVYAHLLDSDRGDAADALASIIDGT